MADRHLPLLHHLEQRGLDLRRRAVDLVREEEVAEDGPELRVEAAFALTVDPRPDEIRRDEVRRELDAGERAPEHGRGRLDRQRLGEAGDSLEQQVPLGKQADDDALEHHVLTGDHPPDLEQRLLETLLCLRRRYRNGVLALLGHVSPPWVAGAVREDSTRP